MRQLSIRIISLIVIIFSFGLSCSQKKTEILSGLYIGQIPPNSTTLKLFASGFISTGLTERDAAFTPNGQEFYFSIWSGSRAIICVSKQEKGKWTSPEVADFSGEYSDVEPFITPDGTEFFFASNRPLEVGAPAKDYDIWRMRRIGDGWSEPENLGSPVNTADNEFYPSLTRDGTLFVTAQYQPGTGEDIYRIPVLDGQYGTPVRLSDAINSPTGEYNAFVAPDESYLIFSSSGRKDGMGSGDLYISFRGENGAWSPAKNMGPIVNSPALDYCPYVTPDGKYFFFSSNRTLLFNQTGKITYAQLKQQSNITGNGDIFWIDASIIETYR